MLFQLIKYFNYILWLITFALWFLQFCESVQSVMLSTVSGIRIWLKSLISTLMFSKRTFLSLLSLYQFVKHQRNIRRKLCYICSVFQDITAIKFWRSCSRSWNTWLIVSFIHSLLQWLKNWSIFVNYYNSCNEINYLRIHNISRVSDT